ncbi:MAG: acyloxyacyl hydrolase [Acidobacteriaceae bacterium]|nr:acyloxyacyl hydrolase [Acidobacteriaceae bacterium]
MHKASSDRLKALEISIKGARSPIRAALLSLFAIPICLSIWSTSARAQEIGGFGGKESFGVFSSYSPDSSHMLIGMSEQRRSWMAGLEYTHRIGSTDKVRWDYEFSLLPFYMESDPAVVATTATYGGVTSTTANSPIRVIHIDPSTPVGITYTGIKVYPIYGRETSYAVGMSPLGGRTTFFPRSRIQPSFAVDLGFLVSGRDLPVDDSNRFNFTFAFGPGVQVFSSKHSSVRLEYLYHHISNAGMGDSNPGVDQGVFRLTMSHHR